MQNSDICIQAVSVKETAENMQNIQKAEAEPIRNGDSFRAIFEKLIAGATESGAGSGEQIENGADTEAGWRLDNAFFEEAVSEEAGTGDLPDKFTGLGKDAGVKKAGFMQEKPAGKTPEVQIEYPAEKKQEPELHDKPEEILKPSEQKPQELKRTVFSGKDMQEVRALDSEGKKIKKPSGKDGKKAKVSFAFVSGAVHEKTSPAKKDAAEALPAGKHTDIKNEKVKKQTGGNPVLVVEDLRSSVPQSAGTEVYEAGADIRVETDSSELTVDFKLDAGFSAQPAETAAGGNASSANEVPVSNFSELLAQEIKNNAADFVQSGKIVLRNQNAGEIKLQLYPENLGSVKIQLKMSGDKKLNGEIVVNSKEAFEAFSESMRELVSSFRDSGFDTQDFNLSWSGEDKNAQTGQGFNAGRYFSPEKTASSISRFTVLAENIYGYGRAENVNIIA